MADPILVTPGQSVGQGDWDALFAQHGGFKSVQTRPATQQEILAAAQSGDQDPAALQAPIYRYYLNDGSYVEARTAPNGADYSVVAYSPSQKFQQAQTQAAKQTDWHPEGTPDPNGPGGYDNSRPIMVRTVSGARETRAPTSAELKDWNEAAQRARNPGGLTDEEARTQQQQQQTATVKQQVDGHPGLVKVTTKNPQTGLQEDHFENAAGQVVPGPGETPKPIPDGKGGFGYWDTTQPGAPAWKPITGGPAAAQTPIADGKGGWGYWDATRPGTPTWVPIKGGPSDAPTGDLPSLHGIVVGAAQDALRQYQSELQDGVAKGRWSQQWASARWQEAVQVANIASTDAATQQREAESTRNAQIDLSKSKATLGQNALTSAANLVSQLNGSLPANSPLGGQAFAAMLGLQMLSQSRSGIDQINPQGPRPLPGPGVTSPTAPTIGPADLASQEAIAAKRAEVERAAAAAAAPVVPPRGVDTQPGAAAFPSSAASPAAAAVAPSPSRNPDTQPGTPAFPTPPTPAGVGSRVVDTAPDQPMMPSSPTPAGVGSRVVDTDPSTPAMPPPPDTTAAPPPSPIPGWTPPGLPGTPVTTPGPFTPPDARVMGPGDTWTPPGLPGTPAAGPPGPFTPPDARTLTPPTPPPPGPPPPASPFTPPDATTTPPLSGIWSTITSLLPGQPATSAPGPFTPPDARTNAPPAAPGSGLEQPDDWLTVRNTGDGSTTVIRRSQWDAAQPAYRSSFEVTNAVNGATPQPQASVGTGQAGSGDTWGVLSSFRQPTPPPQTQPDVPSTPTYPAALAASVKRVPPWLMSNEQIAHARAMGVPEGDIWSAPGSSGSLALGAVGA